ncbi:MAG: DUF952 domain-containing protein [Sphingobacteriales bacterium]|nr:MAG: DUF952 domain-containing protein [Sphingobacteriales bacterium]
MSLIYHITSQSAWQRALELGRYEAPSLAAEGFIHCSHESQIAGVLSRYYAGRTDMLKLNIDPEKLTSRLIYEWSPSVADTFPHVYGPINLDAVESTEPVAG